MFGLQSGFKLKKFWKNTIKCYNSKNILLFNVIKENVL